MTVNPAPNATFDNAHGDTPAMAAASGDARLRVPFWNSQLLRLAGAREMLQRRLASQDMRAVLTGAAQVMAIRMGGAVLAYVSSIFLARWLGTFEFGIFAYVWVWMLILAISLPLGYPSSALRFLPDYFARKKWGRLRGFMKQSVAVAIGASTVGAIVSAILTLVFSDWMEPYYILPFLIGLLCVPATAMLNQMEGASRAFGWLPLAFMPNYIVRPILLMGIVYVLFALGLHPTAVEAVWALVAACIVGATGQAILVRRRIARIVPDVKPIHHTRHWATISLSFVTIDGFRQVLENSDVLMIGHLLDPSAVAAYYAAVRTGGLIAFIYFAVVALAGPRFVKIHIGGSRDEMQRFVSGVIQLMFWPSLLAAAMLALLGPWILSLFGSDFENGYPALLIVLCGLMVRAATGPVEYMLNLTGHHRDTIRVYGVSAICCILSNLVLIPALGITGAAISSYATIAGTNLWLSLLVRRRLGVTAFLGFTGR
jgi:O-antigen/teichoic acid export membrane protein